jgi:hypothetical protein
MAGLLASVAASGPRASSAGAEGRAQTSATVAVRYFTDLRTPWTCKESVPNVTMNRVRPTTYCGIWQPAELGSMTAPVERWANGGGITQIATKYGRGFRVVTTPEMTAPWGGKQAWLVDVDHLTPYDSFLGAVERWSGVFMFPSSGNRKGFAKEWHAGVLWEWHTETMSGNHFGIDGTTYPKPRLRFAFARPDGGYDFAYSKKPLKLDHWYAWSIEIKWSYGHDGYLNVSIGDELSVYHTGATVKDGERPYLQFGYYAVPRLRNEVWHAAIFKSAVQQQHRASGLQRESESIAT